MALPPILQNLELPVIASPMFIVSGPELVIAQCKAGIVGSFPALNARPAEMLEQWIVRIKKELAEYQEQNPTIKVAPFAVNQICHASNDRLQHDMEVCVAQQVPIIITSLRPPKAVIDAVHSYGGIVLHDTINIRHTKKALGEGADGIIAVCAGAGGHAGQLSPYAFLPEIRQFHNGPLLCSGAISTGGAILGAQAIGADLAYIGSVFIASKEANADPAYKQMIVDSTGDDIVYSSLFTGIAGNYLKPSITKAGLDPEALDRGGKDDMNFGSSSSKAWKDIWGSGQGIGSVHDIPSVADIVTRLKQEYQIAKKRIC